MADQPPQKRKSILSFFGRVDKRKYEEEKQRNMEMVRKQGEEAAVAKEQQAAKAKAAKRPVGRPRKQVVVNLVDNTPVSKLLSKYCTEVCNTFLRKTMALDPSSTAIVCIEYQNEFATPGGKLHDAVIDVMSSTNMLEKTVKLTEEARGKGVAIIHAPITFSDDYRELSPAPYGILGNVKAGGAFKASEWGGAICEAMKPQPQDVVVEGKRGLCGFASTNLDFILRHRGIRTVALCGFLTNCCVESTMRSAYEAGYTVITLTDCCAATSQEQHDAAVKFTFPMFSKPMTAEEFAKQLEA